MAVKIIPARKRVSEEKWAVGYAQRVRDKLLKIAKDDPVGSKAALEEAFAYIVITDDNEMYCEFLHHDLTSSGELVLSKDALKESALTLRGLNCTKEQRRNAARHLLAHFEEAGYEAPNNVVELAEIEPSTKEESNMLFTVNAKGDIIAIDGKTDLSRVDGPLGLKLFTITPQEFAGPNIPVQRLPGGRKENWPDGESEDGKFQYATFRSLSATVVNPDTFPVDFTEPDVLKRATSFLRGVPFMKDHRRNVDSQVGSVQDTIWQEGNGKVPGGINSLVRVNALAPQSATIVPLIREMDANSVSVTVWFEWKKSHDDLDDRDFFRSLGDKIDGQLVRAIVTKVLSLTELSLVWDGADRFAERIKAQAAEDSSSVFTFASGVSLDAPGGPAQVGQDVHRATGEGGQETNREPEMDKMLKEALCALLGIEPSAITEQFLTDLKVGAFDLSKAPQVAKLLEGRQAKVDEYAALLQTRKAENAELTAKLAAAEESAKLGEQYLKDVREAAAAAYKAAEGDKADEVILSMIEKAGLAEAQSLGKRFKEQFEKAVPLKCQGCGSEKVSRQQSAGDDGSGANGAGSESDNTDPGVIEL